MDARAFAAAVESAHPAPLTSELADLVARAHRLLDLDLPAAADAWALHHRGWARFHMGESVNALEDGLASLEIFGRVGDDVGTRRALCAIAAVYDTTGETSLALEHLRRALALQTETGDRWGEARTRHVLASSLAEAGELSEAVAAFRQVEEIYREVGEPSSIVDRSRAVGGA
jgi:tetratricopeptide (TPR) repeat protein